MQVAITSYGTRATGKIRLVIRSTAASLLECYFLVLMTSYNQCSDDLTASLAYSGPPPTSLECRMHITHRHVPHLINHMLHLRKMSNNQTCADAYAISTERIPNRGSCELRGLPSMRNMMKVGHWGGYHDLTLDYPPPWEPCFNPARDVVAAPYWPRESAHFIFRSSNYQGIAALGPCMVSHDCTSLVASTWASGMVAWLSSSERSLACQRTFVLRP